MNAKTIGLILFFLGLVIINGTTTIGFIWLLAGLPAPEMPTEPTVMAALLGGFITPFGALLMVVGGLVYGKKERRWSNEFSSKSSLLDVALFRCIRHGRCHPLRTHCLELDEGSKTGQRISAVSR